jgi:hypothetical protein
VGEGGEEKEGGKKKLTCPHVSHVTELNKIPPKISSIGLTKFLRA